MIQHGDVKEVQKVLADADCLYTQEQIEKQLDRMAKEITARYQNSNPIFLCVMTGAMVPAGHLLTRLNFPLELDYIHATRYAGATTGGELAWETEAKISFQDRNIIVFDDILDEGVTLAAIMDYCHRQGAREVATAVLVEKLHDRKHGIQADFIGVQIEDRYVFGYGMDYHGYLRNIPGIYAVKGL